MARTQAGKAERWRQRLQRFQQAQTTVARFCRREGVSLPAFDYWRKKLAAQAPPTPPPPAVQPLGLTPDIPGTPGLLPLDIDRVSRVVGFLNVEATTDLAVRVLTGAPASHGRTTTSWTMVLSAGSLRWARARTRARARDMNVVL